MGSEFFKTDVIQILQYLLPGFVATWIFYGFTAHEKATPFERVVEALIFLVPVQVSVIIVEWIATYGRGGWNSNVKFSVSFLSSVVLGLAFAYFANHDWPHSWFRAYQLTKQTSFPSEWYSAFHQQEFPFWVVLHLKGDQEKRLYGAAEEFPDQPNEGHFVLQRAEWLDAENRSTPLDNVEKILIPATEVKYVEMVRSDDRRPPTGEARQTIETVPNPTQING